MKNFAGVIILAILTVANTGICKTEGFYRLIREIPVGGETKWDYLTVDSDAHRLYIAHANKISVVDIKKNRVIGEVPNTPGAHGFAIAHWFWPWTRRGFSSNGKENKASIVKLNTLETIAKVDTGPNPDAILYVPTHKEVYTFNGKGASTTVFHAKTGTVMATIALPGKPEFSVYDPFTDRIFVNIEDKSEVAVIDAKKHEVLATWRLAPGEEPTGMAFDSANQRLFVGCHNQLMVMVDTFTGRVVTTAPIGEGVDANAFDPKTRLAFSSNGEGTVTIVREESPENLFVSQVLVTEKGARTMALDPKTHNIYLAAPSPDGLKILVYGLKK